MDLEDKELVLQTLKGDRSAFTKLFYKYRKMVHALAFQMIGPETILEDILQETFFRAYKQLPSLKQQEHFGTWLGGICKYVSQEYLKTKRAKPFSIEKLESETLYEIQKNTSLDESTRQQVFQKVGELPEIFREVVLLKYVENLSYEEIAQLLNISAATVNARLFKAKILLKSKLKHESES